MFPRIRGSDRKSTNKEKFDCKCVDISINEIHDEEEKVINVDCSSHPGFCAVDESGLCTKSENLPHCSVSPVELIGEIGAIDKPTGEEKIKETCSGKWCGKKFHSYKIDLNNAEDTGLAADKQCQTCGPNCSSLTCSNRSREFYISWDKKRCQLFIIIILVFGLWILIYVSVATIFPIQS